MEQSSESELRRLAVILDDANDAITMQDLQGNILAWNKAATKMYGYTEAEALKMNIKDIVPKEKGEELSLYLDKISQGDIVDSFTTKRRKKDGSLIDVWLIITCLRDDDGNIDSLATTEKKVTKELKEYHDILPICSSCKAIRNKQGEWEKIELYLQNTSHSMCSHSICPICAKKLYGYLELYEE